MKAPFDLPLRLIKTQKGGAILMSGKDDRGLSEVVYCGDLDTAEYFKRCVEMADRNERLYGKPA